MGTLQVLFDVPRFIEHGLSSGAFERVGGVIVEAGSKRIVAWLRDGGAVEVTNQLLNSTNPLNAIAMAVQTATSLVGTVVTNQKLSTIQDSVVQLTNISQQTLQGVQVAANLAAFTAAGQLVNIGLMAISFHQLTTRVEKLHDRMEELFKSIHAEFDYDRVKAFEASIKAARDFFESEQASTRDNSLRVALDGLYIARKNFLKNHEQFLLQAKTDPNQLELAHQALLQAMYAEVTRIKCYIESNDLKIAKQDLQEVLPIFRQAIVNLLNSYLDENGAIYFHKLVSNQTLDRFLQIQFWLQDKNPRDPQALFEVINAYRSDFWNEELIQHEYAPSIAGLVGRVANAPTRRFEDRVKGFDNALTQCEVLIENYHRLVGFQLEIADRRLSSFQEWHRLTQEQQIDDSVGFYMVVDSDYLQEAV